MQGKQLRKGKHQTSDHQVAVYDCSFAYPVRADYFLTLSVTAVSMKGQKTGEMIASAQAMVADINRMTIKINNSPKQVMPDVLWHADMESSLPIKPVRRRPMHIWWCVKRISRRLSLILGKRNRKVRTDIYNFYSAMIT